MGHGCPLRGCLLLHVEVCRYRTLYHLQTCNLCKLNSVETEFHFVMECPALQDLRSSFFDCLSYLDNQWHGQDTEVARAQDLHAAETPSFFSYQDWLSWHLCASHCKQSLLGKVSWRAWHCAELALFILALLRAPSTKLVVSISEILNSYLPVGLPGHKQTLPGPGPEWVQAWLRHCR